ncbi:uncharacterized mitochondrial protein atmg00810 [Phtheirospermum japonicum]|uniref:Uncharacterized mitochondrial protein atmg00810 n=1 Tax=Phtheirospermum japonicum TaxID=374723 RepID=A0A830C2S4_9LAMI|nr:uncharacterized mitochondrial protein atmg00810 [Phtheirospermum japonicum]
MGLLYKDHGITEIVGYTDADCADLHGIGGRHQDIVFFLMVTCLLEEKQDVIARSSVEVEYRSMALGTCELIWLKHLFEELKFRRARVMKLSCDNQAALHIASNQYFMGEQNTFK